MPRVLQKTSLEHFAKAALLLSADANQKELSFKFARKLARRTIMVALQERSVKGQWSNIKHKKLENVWQGATHRLPTFLNRINWLVNLHLPDGKSITMKTPPVESDVFLRDLRVEIAITIIKKIHEG